MVARRKSGDFRYLSSEEFYVEWKDLVKQIAVTGILVLFFFLVIVVCLRNDIVFLAIGLAVLGLLPSMMYLYNLGGNQLSLLVNRRDRSAALERSDRRRERNLVDKETS